VVLAPTVWQALATAALAVLVPTVLQVLTAAEVVVLEPSVWQALAAAPHDLLARGSVAAQL